MIICEIRAWGKRLQENVLQAQEVNPRGIIIHYPPRIWGSGNLGPLGKVRVVELLFG